MMVSMVNSSSPLVFHRCRGESSSAVSLCVGAVKVQSTSRKEPRDSLPILPHGGVSLRSEENVHSEVLLFDDER